MKTLKVAICDDDSVALSVASGTLTEIFKKEEVEAVIKTYPPTPDIVDKLGGGGFDLLFLDINLGGMDGIEIAKQLRKNSETLEIIFFSGEEDRVFDAFAVRPYGFVRKNKIIQDFGAVVKMYLDDRKAGKVSSKRMSVPDIIEIKEYGAVENIKISTIVYIEALRGCQFIHIAGKEPKKVRITMSEFETKLKPYGFIRVHKGYLVNFRCIRRVNNADVVLTDGSSIPVSRGRFKETRSKFIEYNRRRSLNTPK